MVISVSCELGCGNSNESILAKVGGKLITEKEFKERYGEFLQLTSAKDNLLFREKFLEAMINEALLIDEAHRLGLSKTAEYESKVEGFRKQALLDEFRKRKIMDTVTVSEKEIQKAFVRLHEHISARHLYAKTQSEADSLYQLLQQGVSFETLAAMTFEDPTLAANGGYLGYFTWGDMDPAFEDAAFSLKVGEISKPVKTRYGYSIIRAEDRVRNPFLTEYEYHAKREKLRKLIQREKAIEAAKRYSQQLARELHCEFNPETLRLLMQREAAGVAFGDGTELRSTMALDLLEKSLVRFKGGKWSVRDFLDKAQWTSDRQRGRVKDEEDLKRFIQGLVVREELLRRAEATGLRRDPNVQKAIDEDTRAYVLRWMHQVITDSVRVPDAAVEEHYRKFQQQYFFPEEANVREILVDLREQANALLERLQAGEDFGKLAEEHSLRQWAAHRGGELGFAPRGKYGVLADTIFALKVGQVAGPFKIGNYFSIVQLIGKREQRQKSFLEARLEIEKELEWQWKRRAAQAALDALKARVPVVIFDDKLRALVL